ncbi:MAG: methionine--tRNA ligase [Candidatus Omnitrophota bacterium]
MGKFYITTPIYYVNANPHIGHAYTQIAVDTLSRYHKMLGDEVFFLTGTDEHGEKIEEASVKAGFGEGKEKDFVDTIVSNFKKVWKELDVEYDYFIRTTDKEHEEEVKEFLQKLYEKGDIYLGEYDGWFCTPCETFWTDKQAEGGVCPECNRPVEHIKEKNYFFKMSKYQDWLIEYINKHPEFVMPKFRENEVKGFLKEKLNDLCISRPKERMSWGVELPFDNNYVLYVWFDALINYISGIKASGRNLKDTWPPKFHVIAKDILRHHAVYWPIMLHSAGYEMPETIFAHGWWKMGEDKMSKSKGNIVDPLELKEKYGVDAIRYFLLKAVIFGNDGVFSEDAFITLYNSDLANDLGNLLNRTLTMVEKYFEGVSPLVSKELVNEEQKKRSREDVISNIANLLPYVKETYIDVPDLKLKDALEHIMIAVGKANKYIEESAPWECSKKGDMESIKLIIADLLEVLRTTSIALFPYMPTTAREMWSQLGLGNIDEEFTKEEFKKELTVYTTEKETFENWERRFPAGTKIAKGEPLFMRIKKE